MRLYGLGSVPAPLRRARFAGVGLAMFGAAGLGLAVVPACGGGGGVGENVAHVAAPAAHVAVAAAVAVTGSHAAPNCGGGGTGSDD